MGVLVEDIRFINEFKATTTNYLLGNIGDKVTIEIDLRAEQVFVTGDNEDIDRILLAPQPFRINTPNYKDVIFCEDLDALVNFKLGDTIALYSSTTTVTSNYEIYEKINDQSIRVHQIAGTPGDVDFSNQGSGTGTAEDVSLGANSYIYITTNLTSIIYRYNFNENRSNGNFNSTIDNQVNRLFSSAPVDNTDTVTQVPLTFASPKTNNLGSAYVKGNGSTTTAQKFTIVHETFITPFFLAEDLNDFKNNIAPNDLRAESSLKFVTSIDVGRTDADPNFIETVDFAINDGNVGWFEENFNGNPTNYFIDSTTYKRNDLSVINAVELTTNEQTVDIVVKNTVDSPFDATTPFSLNFSIMPDDVDDYRNNGKTVIENFYFDRGFSLVNGATVAGQNLGETTQIIKDVNATLTGADEILITATLQLSTEAVSDLSSRNGIEYFFWVSTQDGALDTEEADKISLRVPYSEFYIDITDDGLVSFDTKFLRHYESDFTTEGTTNLIARTEDDILGYTQFSIDRLGRETDEILINNVGVGLVAKKSDGSEFTLEDFNQSLNGALIVGDSQFIDNTLDRVFQMPTNEQRKQIAVKRRIDLDTTDLRYYEIKYPFLFRWEYWVALAGVNSDAFDTNEPNNGYNEQWHRYDTLTDWDIYYRTTLNLTKNGDALTYQEDTLMSTFTYDEDSDWTNETILALDANTLVDNGNLLVRPTRIKASFTYAGGTPPTIDEVEFILRIEVYEQGGISDIRFFSSVYDWSEFSWFSSIDNKLVKSLNAGVYSCEALLNIGDLPTNSNYKISARIHDKTASPVATFCILQEDLEPILQENAVDCIEIEHT